MELPNGICSPRPNMAGMLPQGKGTLGLGLDKHLKLGQALTGALTMALHFGVGTQNPTAS